MRNILIIAAAAAFCSAVSVAHASSVTYDFKAAANSGGGIGESIHSTFSTSSFGGFAGPNLDITASASDDNDLTQYVYFDAGNAGIGVCKDPTDGAVIGKFYNGGTNRCNPSSDDGITTTSEVLSFKATTGSVLIHSIWLNSNHDGGGILDTIWKIGGVQYDMAAMVLDSVSGTGDVRIDINFLLGVGETLMVEGVLGPNSYVSAISLSAVPLPAPALLLIGGLGALSVAARRKRKAA